MLEVKNLTKVYKTKGGADVNALDGVTMRFPETGMVFLLGKSGSGKSTLLNVCGGLDSPTSGEIIVKGRSSKNFSQSDFDSYRNTFIGFIFQEYNILNEFSVEDNIALALELQGKPKDKKAIAELLEEVDLTGYAKRKPNTLSGGQKQRIAIARALVKQPEIIMADEPTGALDSATGKQVFDTLKKLSKTKLIVVVSHDRDFAEQYGDRIIELKDGKIISDITKTQEEQRPVSGNVTAIGDTLCLKAGAELTDKDFNEIKAFLKSAKTDVVIASGERDVKAFKEVSRITDDGKKEVFRDTNENELAKKDYKPEDSKFIRSKLPMKHAMKLGASGLKTKPFRLIFTILLSTIAFVMFGLFSTMMLYDKETTLYQSIDDANPQVLRISKKYRQFQYNQSEEDDEPYVYDEEFMTAMTKTELDSLSSKFGSESFGVVALATSWNGFDSKEIALDSTEAVGRYYSNKLAYFGYLPENNGMRSRITVGQYPASDNEICISSYTASVLVAHKLGNATTVNDLIDKTITLRLDMLGDTQFKICGIFNSDDDILASKYSSLQEASQRLDSEAESLLKKFSAELADGMHLVAFTTENVQNLVRENRQSYTYEQSPLESMSNYKYRLSYKDNGDYDLSAYYLKASELTSVAETKFFDNSNTALDDNEVFVTPYLLSQMMNSSTGELYNTAEQEYRDARETFNNTPPQEFFVNVEFWEFYNGNYSEQEINADNAIKKGYEFFQEVINKPEYAELKAQMTRNQVMSKYIKLTIQGVEIEQSVSSFLSTVVHNSNLNYGENESLTPTKTDKMLILNALIPEFKNADFTFTGKAMNVEGDNTAVSRGQKPLKVVGLIITDNTQEYIALSDATYEHFKAISDAENPNYHSSRSWRETKYQKPADGVYDAIYIPYNSSLKSELSMFSFEWAEDDSRLCISHAVGDALEMVNAMIDEMSQIFMWIGIVMAVFAALLLSNFISVSISHKKRDIGILRAVGARSFDVFKIFFSESFLIAIISIIVSLIGCFVACSAINTEMGSALSGVSLFVFGPMSALILIGVAVVTAIVATFLPVYNAAKKKPVESIRAL